MQQEIILDRKFDLSEVQAFPPNQLFLLLGYQDEQLTLVLDALRYRPLGATEFELEIFRTRGFADGEELAEAFAAAREMLVGGLYVCGLLLTSAAISDASLLEEKLQRLPALLAEVEEFTSPELMLLSYTDGRTRLALLNRSTLTATVVRQPLFEDFRKRIGLLHLFLSGSYATAEEADLRYESAFLGEVCAAARRDLLAAEYLAENQLLARKSVLGPISSGELVKLHSADEAVTRLLAAGANEARKGGVEISMALFCYYSFRNRTETVLEHFCQDFERSLFARVARADGNAFLPSRLLIAHSDLAYNCYVASSAEIKENVQTLRRRLVPGTGLEVLDYEKIDTFQWKPFDESEGAMVPQAKPEELSRALPQLITVCLAVLLAFLLKKVFLN